MRNTNAKLLRRLTRAAAPFTAKPSEVRSIYRDIKRLYLSKPGPERPDLKRKLEEDALDIGMAKARELAAAQDQA